MATTKKEATILIKEIVKAKNPDEGINVLDKILEALHLSTSYTEMVRLSNELKKFQKNFNEVSKNISPDKIMSYDELTEIRVNLNFLYRDIVDELSHDINFHKIYYEELKTVRRAEGLKELKGSKIAEEFKAKSTSALQNILGDSETYKQYVTEYAIAYANYKTLDNLLNSIRQTVDAIASREKKELNIKQKY